MQLTKQDNQIKADDHLLAALMELEKLVALHLTNHKWEIDPKVFQKKAEDTIIGVFTELIKYHNEQDWLLDGVLFDVCHAVVDGTTTKKLGQSGT